LSGPLHETIWTNKPDISLKTTSMRPFAFWTPLKKRSIASAPYLKSVVSEIFWIPSSQGFGPGLFPDSKNT
jgi:hypothetical protein